MPQCGHNIGAAFAIVILGLEGRIIKYSGRKIISKKNTPIAQIKGDELPRFLAS